MKFSNKNSLIKRCRPVTKSLRSTVFLSSAGLSKCRPERTLVTGKKRISGRDGSGGVSVRRRGGGAKRLYRELDFKRDKDNLFGIVRSIEYDPNRSARVALVFYSDGEKRYLLAWDGIKIGDKIKSGKDSVDFNAGDALPLSQINDGSFVHSVEITPGAGGVLVRSAGTFAKLLGKDGKYSSLQLPSGEVRLILSTCRATLGVVGNKERKNISLGKAGRSRYLGRRPKVRGVAMNPVDHPMGGGEGKTSGGRHPVSFSGVLSKGYKTRDKKRYSAPLILKKRR